MRLLNADTFKLEDFFYGNAPPYAILSHTWGIDSEEISYRDVLNGRLDSAATRPLKVTGCCKEAKKDGYQYVWIDTCCIDKTNSVELQEAINSMFRWYRDAAICYAYLSDVPPGDAPSDAKSAFSTSRWFQRGWTLQELLAPLSLRFYDAGWACMGTKGDLCDLVEAVTKIPTSFLLGITELHHASVAQRMSWAANRVTKRQEDVAYCLLGIFGVSMPMIYGEGYKAFRRLQEQIMKDVGDDSILAWDLDLEGRIPTSVPNAAFGTANGPALAPDPSYFANSGKIVAMDHLGHDSFEVHGGSLRLPLTLGIVLGRQTFGYLRCVHEERNLTVGIPLVAAPGGQPHKYFRVEGRQAILIHDAAHEASAPLIYIQLDRARKLPSQAAGSCWFHIQKSVPDLELVSVHPKACWHKERALIEAAVEPSDDGVQRILARFRGKGSTSAQADFVAVLEVDSKPIPRCNLMVAFRETPLEELAHHWVEWKDLVSGIKVASNIAMHLGLEMHEVSSSQRRFILKPVVLSLAPSVTVDATVQLLAVGVAAVLQQLRRIDELEEIKAEVLLEERRNGKQRLVRGEVELEKVRAEIEALKLKERRLAEELDREQELESKLLDAYDQAKQAKAGIQQRISDMERFRGIYCDYVSAEEYIRDPSSKGEDACLRAAEQMLPFAVEMGYDSLARVFINHAVSVTAEDSSGKTALHHAVWRGQAELVRVLIEKGADVNSSDTSGVTPLYMAIERRFENIAYLLFNSGADVTAKTEEGDTPLDLALRGQQNKIAALLQRYKARMTRHSHVDRRRYAELDAARERQIAALRQGSPSKRFESESARRAIFEQLTQIQKNDPSRNFLKNDR